MKQKVERASVGFPLEGMHPSFESGPIGDYLRRQRLLRGISAEDLARLTRIPLRSIERLESGQFDGQSDGFVRGFVRTVADALGLDAEDTISRMLEEPGSSVRDRREGRDDPGRVLRWGLVGLVVLVLLPLTFFGGRAVWELGSERVAGAGGGEVVVWRDPVRALAEAAGIRPESTADREGPDGDAETDAASSPLRVP